MPTEDVSGFLRRVELFAELDGGILDAVAAAAERRELAPGEALFHEGDPGDSMFIVERGVFEVRSAGVGGTEVVLREMGPGEIGGLTSMAVAKLRSASLIASSAATVLMVPRARFLELLDAHQPLVSALVAFLSGKVRGKTSRLATLIEQGARPWKPRVAVFDTKPYDREFLAAAAGDNLELDFFETRLRPETARLAAGAFAVSAFVNDDLSAATLERLVEIGVDLVAMRCAGTNNVDLEAAARLRMTVVRVPAYSPHAVAEHATAMLLGLVRHLPRAVARVREGDFRLNGLVGLELHGRTAGLVGLGAIGSVHARILAGLGMVVLGSDPYAEPDHAAALGATLVGLDELFERSDVVCLHAPMTKDTHHLVDADRLARMRPGAILVNTSRGGLVDTAALIDALKSGRLGGAALDVYEEEAGTFFEDRSSTVLTDDVLARLLTFSNVIVTSHQAFLTEEALTAIAETTVASLRAYRAGARGPELVNVVSVSLDRAQK